MTTETTNKANAVQLRRTRRCCRVAALGAIPVILLTLLVGLAASPASAAPNGNSFRLGDVLRPNESIRSANFRTDTWGNSYGYELIFGNDANLVIYEYSGNRKTPRWWSGTNRPDRPFYGCKVRTYPDTVELQYDRNFVIYGKERIWCGPPGSEVQVGADKRVVLFARGFGDTVSLFNNGDLFLYTGDIYAGTAWHAKSEFWATW